jgi:hypothetical protein
MPDELVPGSAAAPADGSGEDVGASPAPTCKKHGVEKRKYGKFWQCLKCQNDARKLREQRLRTGEQTGLRRLTKPEARARKAKIAAMAGAGASPALISKELAIKQDYVEQILRKDVKHDEFLQGVYREAEKTLAPKAFAAAQKLVDHIANVAEGYNAVVGKDEDGNPIVAHVDTAPQHAAVALREMRPFIGMGDKQGGQGGAGGAGGGSAPATIQINSPEALSVVVRALRAHREEQQQAKQQLVEGERVG